jgi:peptide-methionine (S)-S-oxide reductase
MFLGRAGPVSQLPGRDFDARRVYGRQHAERDLPQSWLSRRSGRDPVRSGEDDIGTSYRSAIYYTTDEQRRIAEDTIADVDASGLWPGRVVTEVAPAGAFWEAEPEHQDYLLRNPGGYTCHFLRPDWVLPRRKTA